MAMSCSCGAAADLGSFDFPAVFTNTKQVFVRFISGHFFHPKYQLSQVLSLRVFVTDKSAVILVCTLNLSILLVHCSTTATHTHIHTHDMCRPSENVSSHTRNSMMILRTGPGLLKVGKKQSHNGHSHFSWDPKEQNSKGANTPLLGSSPYSPRLRTRRAATPAR